MMSYMSLHFHTLRQEQWIPRPIHEVFAFFSDARNLENITPSSLHFRILSMTGPKLDTSQIQEGTKIRYRLSMHGIPLYWTTTIRRWRPPHYFTDIQTSGPYKLWHHTHRFEDHGARTRMTDVVRYKLPFGILGRIVHRLTVRNEIKRIFGYRRSRIDQLFAQQDVTPNMQNPK